MSILVSATLSQRGVTFGGYMSILVPATLSVSEGTRPVTLRTDYS